MIAQQHRAIRDRVRAAWLERAEALDLKGKKRDDAVMNFLTGVRIGLIGLKGDDQRTAVDGLVFICATRGAKYLEDPDC